MFRLFLAFPTTNTNTPQDPTPTPTSTTNTPFTVNPSTSILQYYNSRRDNITKVYRSIYYQPLFRPPPKVTVVLYHVSRLFTFFVADILS